METARTTPLTRFVVRADVAGRAADPVAGQVVDHTANHGVDRRIWSAALGQKRDLYVYVPPSFDPHQRYPVLLWLHGLSGDASGWAGMANEEGTMPRSTVLPRECAERTAR